VTDRAVLTLTTADADATRTVGAALAAQLRPGDVVSLSGELGAGKTCLVQGAAAALRVTDRVTSPTFVLVKTYAGRLRVVHVDVYRLDRLQDVLDLGDEVFAADVVTFVEWGDAIAALLPEDRLDVDVRLLVDAAAASDGDAPRGLDLVAHGSWLDRLPDLAEVLARYRRTPDDEA
jgi:tRNA threonylcarbamoyladenosine biosynthesis protein TsaE